MPFLLLLAVLLAPSLSLAAYQNPTVVSNDRQPGGTTLITFLFSGNAGEPDVRRTFMVGPNATATLLRNWVDSTINELNLIQTAATLPILQPGQIVPRLAPVAPVPTAKQVWLEKFNRYIQAQNSGISALSSALTALKADLEATYQAGYYDGQP